MLTDEDIKKAGNSAKPLFLISEDENFKNEIQNLKEYFKSKGLNEGILKIQLIASIDENQTEILKGIAYTDKGSMFYYSEQF